MSEVNKSNGNGSAATGEITGFNASTRAQVKHLQKLAAAAVEAVQGLAFGVRSAQRAFGHRTHARAERAVHCAVEAELHSGGEYDQQREAELLALWRKLHPGTLPGIIVPASPKPHHDDIPF